MVVNIQNDGPRVLVINPNTSTFLTDTFHPILSSLPLSSGTTLSYWTCPTGPAVIKSVADMYESVSHSLPLLLELAPHFDGFLAACYADHPLVRLLQSQVKDKPVVGIFDASVYAALRLVSPSSKFGIITTGAPYELLLSKGVSLLLDHNKQELARFAGVAASGVGLADLKSNDNPKPTTAKGKIMEATKCLLQGEGGHDVDVLCMGGVILTGMEDWVHEACEEVLGVVNGRRVKVVEQLAAGMLTLDALLTGKSPQLVDYHQALR